MRAAGNKTQGTCFGFAVHSQLPFHFLRGGSGDRLYVTLPSQEGTDAQDRLVREWLPTPEVPYHSRLYRNGALYRLWLSSTGWFVIDLQAQRIDLPASGDAVQREQRLWGIPAVLCFLSRGDLPLHAAAVQVRNSAIILAAPGGFGKTTLAAGFHRAGYRVLSEDVACVRLGHPPAVIPGPALLRVRRNVLDALALPDVRPVAETDDRTILAIEPARRGDCQPVPIMAVVLLRSAGGGFKIDRIPAEEAIRDLWALSFKMETERARTFGQVAELIKHVSVYNVYRPLTISEIDDTVGRLVSRLPES